MQFKSCCIIAPSPGFFLPVSGTTCVAWDKMSISGLEVILAWVRQKCVCVCVRACGVKEEYAICL